MLPSFRHCSRWFGLLVTEKNCQKGKPNSWKWTFNQWLIALKMPKILYQVSHLCFSKKQSVKNIFKETLKYIL